MSDIKVPQAKYFNLSAYQVLRGMVRLYGLQEVWSALSEIAAEQNMQPTGSSRGHIVATCECEICSIMRRLPKDASG